MESLHRLEQLQGAINKEEQVDRLDSEGDCEGPCLE